MVERSDRESLRVPDGTRVFYIGPPKTGTTTLQEAARAARPTLRAHGVYYPGRRRNHREEVHALMGEPDAIMPRVGGRMIPPGCTRADADRIPPLASWSTLMQEVDDEDAPRTLLTHEHAALATTQQARRFVDELGPGRTHIVLTLRPLSEVLVSQWIENLKVGTTETFEEWMGCFLDPAEGDERISAGARRYLDQGGLVRRWAQVVGAEHVTVIVVDKTRRDLLTGTFEQMLGLPTDTLTGRVGGGRQTNRSMSGPEASVVQHLNATICDPELSWPVYLEVVRKAINHMLEARTPEVDESRVRLPHWAADRVTRKGQECAEQIGATGVRVVGDLHGLYAEPQVASDPPQDLHQVPHAVAVEAMVGAVQGAAVIEKRGVTRTDKARTALQREKQRAQDLGAQLEATTKDLQQTRRRLDRERRRGQKARATVTALRRRSLTDQVRSIEPDRRARAAAESFTTHDLVRATAMRLRHKLRTGRSLRSPG